MLYRNFDRMVVWLFTPHDDMLLVESELKVTHQIADTNLNSGGGALQCIHSDNSHGSQRRYYPP